MKHVFLILLTIVIILTGIVLPYIHGDYDYFAVGLSYIFQFATFTSLLLVPIGLIWCIMDFINRGKNHETVLYPVYLRKAALIVILVIVLAAALGAFASHNRFSAIIILCLGVFFSIPKPKKC